MALIKCTECGKEISDKADKCIHCGYSLKNEKEPTKEKKNKKAKKVITKKSIITNIIVFIITLAGAFFLNLYIDNYEIFFYTMGLTVGLQFTITFLLYYLDTGKIKHKWFNIFLILQVLSMIWFVISISVVMEYINSEVYSRAGFIEESSSEKDIEVITDNRTPKEKMIDYLKEYNDAVCDSHKCTYTFTPYAVDQTTYYTLDFDNKKFISESYILGSIYDEYNYISKTGYNKTVNDIVWTTTTTTNVVFNDDGSYTYECYSDLPGYCEELGDSSADTIISTRDVFLGDCNRAGVNPSDL